MDGTGIDITQLITQVVFPIVAYLLLFWYFREETNANREQITKMQTDHKEEMNTMTEAINNNTLTMQKLVDKLGEK